jgi:hypothetical protein
MASWKLVRTESSIFRTPVVMEDLLFGNRFQRDCPLKPVE